MHGDELAQHRPGRLWWPEHSSTVALVEPVIAVRDLRKSYGDVERLHGISFTVETGEIIGLLGTNGAGKTTTIEILEGFRDVSSGEVRVLGSDPAKADRSWRNRIGLVLQESELNPIYTVRETVGLFARYFDQPNDVNRTISTVGLGEKVDARIGQLSGGEKRRVDVALGLIGGPDVLFLDEPTTGLDPAARREIWSMVGGLRSAGKTIFLTTHYMDEAQHLADNIVIMRAGSIAAEGTPDELRHRLGNASDVSFALPAEVSLEQLGSVVGCVVEFDGQSARFRSDRAQDDLTLLLDWAQRRNVTLTDLQVSIPTLDDVFLALADGHDTDGDEIR
jgi:ABC-2 type transport system ATP-binding protein